MTIQEAHYHFKLLYDRVDTLSKPNFRAAEIDWLLNRAQSLFIKRKYDPTFETRERIYQDLANLVIKFPEQPTLIPTVTSGVYEVDLSTLKYDYIYVIAASSTITHNNCVFSNVPLKPIAHDDYLDALRDPFNNSSSEFVLYNYGRTSNNPLNVSIYMYPDTHMTIDTVKVEYIKEPKRVSLGNYTYLDGIMYPPTTFEVTDTGTTHMEIIELAVMLASLSVEDPEFIRLKSMHLELNNP